jgi:hypothetical protein
MAFGIDIAVRNAYNIWRQRMGLLSALGAWTFLLAITIGSVAALPANYVTGNIQIAILSVATVLLMVTYQTVGIIVNYAVRQGFPANEAIRRSFSDYPNVASAVLIASIPWILGLLLATGFALAGILYPNNIEILSILSFLSLVGGALVANVFTTLPYRSAEKPWIGAWDSAIRDGRDLYITLLLTNLFYALIYITIIALAGPNYWPIILFAVDAGFLMHLRHQTYFEIIRSVSARE